MSVCVQDWLPDGAITDDAVKAALSDAARGWSLSWFGRPDVQISRVRLLHAAGPTSADEGVVRADAVLIRFAEEGKRRLLEAALLVALAENEVSDDDRLLLDAFARRIAEDLVACLESSARPSVAMGAGEAQMGFVLMLSGADLLSVYLPRGAVVRAIRAQLAMKREENPGPKAVPQPLSDSLIRALAPVTLDVQAVLGRGQLSVEELQELAVGDVVLLDRALGEVVELCVQLDGGEIRSLGHGRLGRNNDRVAIQF